MCAVIADGYFAKRKTVTPQCRINIKKNRKIERLRTLLQSAGIEYKECNYNPKDPEFRTFIFYAPRVEKEFGAFWYGCNQHQLSVISDEVLLWDGCTSGGREIFSTTSAKTADFVQFAFSATGYRSRIRTFVRGNRAPEYRVSRTTQTRPSLINTKNRIEIPVVPSQDGYKYCFTVPSGMLVLRHNGAINITGNSGKTSIISQLICQSVEDGKNVWMYSGELPNSQTKNWIRYIFAGQRNVQQFKSGDTTYWKVTPEAKKQIDDFYRGRMFIDKDGEDNTVESILSRMEAVTRKYGAKLLIIDNLTAVNLGGYDKDKYERQAVFVKALIDFAKKFNVAVILVVHPHKLEQMRRMTKMDVQGISAIIDLAHRILSLYRVQPSDHEGIRKKNGTGFIKEPIREDVLCDILKDRMMGFEGKTVGLFYDRASRRFFTNEQDLDKRYKWDRNEYHTPLPFPPTQLQDQDNEVFGVIKEDSNN